MSLSNAVVTKYTNTHIMGTATLKHKAGEDKVLFVAPMPKDFVRHQAPNLDNEARFFSSPMIAETQFQDLSSNGMVMPSFTGRSLGVMEEHLVRQAK